MRVVGACTAVVLMIAGGLHRSQAQGYLTGWQFCLWHEREYITDDIETYPDGAILLSGHAEERFNILADRPFVVLFDNKGSIKWGYTFLHTLWKSSHIAIAGDRIVMGFDDVLVVLDTMGNIIYAVQVRDFYYYNGITEVEPLSPTTALVIAGANTDGTTLAKVLDVRNGTFIKSVKYPRGYSYRGICGVSVSGDKIALIVEDDSVLMVMDTSFSVLWAVTGPVGKCSQDPRTAVQPDGSVYVRVGDRVLHFDSRGTLRWSKRYSRMDDNDPNNRLFAAGNNIYLTGWEPYMEYFIVKVDTAGNVEWIKADFNRVEEKREGPTYTISRFMAMPLFVSGYRNGVLVVFAVDLCNSPGYHSSAYDLLPVLWYTDPDLQLRPSSYCPEYSAVSPDSIQVTDLALTFTPISLQLIVSTQPDTPQPYNIALDTAGGTTWQGCSPFLSVEEVEDASPAVWVMRTSRHTFRLYVPDGLSSIALYDVTGRLLHEHSFRRTVTQVWLRVPSDGVYLVRVCNERNCIIRSLIGF